MCFLVAAIGASRWTSGAFNSFGPSSSHGRGGLSSSSPFAACGVSVGSGTVHGVGSQSFR